MTDITQASVPPRVLAEEGQTALNYEPNWSEWPSHLNSNCVIFDTGIVYISDTFRGLDAAHVINVARRTFGEKTDIREVPPALIEDFRRFRGSEANSHSGDSEDAPTRRELGVLLREGGSLGCTDVHISTEEERVVTKIRVNRDLREGPSYSKDFGKQLMSAAYSACDHESGQESSYKENTIQQGRILPKKIGGMPGYEAIRCEWRPTATGRHLALRTQKPLDTYGGTLEGLKYEPYHISEFEYCMQLPEGGTIFVAPTNHGKTTIMSMIAKIRMERLPAGGNGITLEDPPEYILRGLQQMPINVGTNKEARQNAFDTGTASINRGDPDFVYLGELRGGEGGDTMVKLARTHPTVGSIHGNGVLSAPKQLIRLGLPVEDAFDEEVFPMFVSQRLVQELCQHCAKSLLSVEKTHSDRIDRLRAIGAPLKKIKAKGDGCSHCNGTGVAGMRPIVETMRVNSTIMQLLKEDKRQEANAYLTKKGTPSIWDCGLSVLYKGLVDPEKMELAAGLLTADRLRIGGLHNA